MWKLEWFKNNDNKKEEKERISQKKKWEKTSGAKSATFKIEVRGGGGEREKEGERGTAGKEVGKKVEEIGFVMSGKEREREYEWS